MANLRKKDIVFIIGIIFMVINTILVFLICNNRIFSEVDTHFWNTKIVLIINGMCFGCFCVAIKFIEHLTVKKLFLSFILIRLIFCFTFILLNLGLEMDFSSFVTFAEKILSGQIFTPYNQSWVADSWRIVPPMWNWWYTFNYLMYGLDDMLWRIVNLFLEVGIVYVVIQIFHENSDKERGWTQENFKLSLSLYIFSVLPIVSILLYANIIAFPALLGILGFLYFYRSKRNPKYLYYATLFFCLAALTELFAAIWIFGILFILLFRKQFKRLIILIGEVIAIFSMVTLPFLMNDALGFLERLFWQYKLFSKHMEEFSI
ncbi:MAG: hypothetical protein ACTSQQ_13750 [Candidatus Helarchaeota archaeon]